LAAKAPEGILVVVNGGLPLGLGFNGWVGGKYSQRITNQSYSNLSIYLAK
jgi:hypothetical protein